MNHTTYQVMKGKENKLLVCNQQSLYILRFMILPLGCISMDLNCDCSCGNAVTDVVVVVAATEMFHPSSDYIV